MPNAVNVLKCYVECCLLPFLNCDAACLATEWIMWSRNRSKTAPHRLHHHHLTTVMRDLRPTYYLPLAISRRTFDGVRGVKLVDP